MPSLSIFGKTLRSSPWAQDDLHYLCLLLGTFRVIQLCAVLPLWVFLYVNKWKGRPIDQEPEWCEPSDSLDGTDTDKQVSLEETETSTIAAVFDDGLFVGDGVDGEVSERQKSRRYLEAYIFSSFVYSISDLALLAAIWSAASVGTPSNPRGRNLFLRPLLRFKVLGMNALLIALVVIGIGMVYFERLDNYGCFEGSIPTFEASAYFVFYCILLVLQAIELGVWPCIIANKISRYLQRNQKLNDEKRRTLRRDRCLGGCLACIGFLTCYKGGGRSVAKEGGFSDVVGAMMDFLHTGGKLDVMFSDIYLAFKMLIRVQRERQYEAMRQSASIPRESCDLETGNDDRAAPSCLDGLHVEHNDEQTVQSGRSLVVGKWSTLARSEQTVIKFDRDRVLCVRATTEALTPERPQDTVLLKEAKHFAEYSFVSRVVAHLRPHGVLHQRVLTKTDLCA